MKIIYDPPKLIKSVFHKAYWETKNNKLLLTFDDGPTKKATEKILRELADHKIKSLFFCVGNNLRKEPSLVKEILSEGHEIGNHTYNHKTLWFSNKGKIENEILSFEQESFKKQNGNSKYFRPVKGRIDFNLYNTLIDLNFKIVMWSLLTLDYKNDLNIVKFAVTKFLKKNSIIVLHDNIKSSKIITNSIKYIAESADNSGFEFGVPSECLK